MADQPVTSWVRIKPDGTEQAVTGFDERVSSTASRAVDGFVLTDPSKVEPRITLSQSPTNPVSIGDRVTMSVTAGHGVTPFTYSWTAAPGAPALTGTGATRAFTVPAGTATGTKWTYTVVVTDSTGAQSSAQTTVGVGVTPPPSGTPLTSGMTLSPPSPLPPGARATFTVAGQGGLPPYSTVFAPAPTGAPALTVAENTASFIVPSSTADGKTWIYQATLTDSSNPAQSVSSSYTVKVKVPVVSTTLMGASIPYMSGAGIAGFQQWDAARVYNFSKVDSTIADVNPKIICLTDSGTANAGGQASADQLDAQLNTIFRNHPNIEIHWAFGNEITRHVPDMTSYKATYAAARQVIDKHRALGRACSLWIDLTHYVIETNPALIDQFKNATAQYLDGIGCSMYPPGRSDTPPSYTDFDDFLTPVFDVCQGWGKTKLSAWEIATTRDTLASRHTVPVRIAGGTIQNISTSNYAQNRPVYAAYMAKYIIEKGAQLGVAIPALCWWDSGSDPYNPSTTWANRFSTDTNPAPWTVIPSTAGGSQPPKASPTTAECWHNWQNWIGTPQ